MIGLRRFISVSIPVLMFCIGAVQLVRHYDPLGYGESFNKVLGVPARDVLEDNQEEIRAALDRQEHQQIKDQLRGAPEISIVFFWILLMILPASLLVLKIKGCVGRKLLELRTESGSKLNVREKAVNRYVQDCLDSMSFVRDVRVKTKTNRGALEMSIRVWVAATQKLDSLQQRIVDTVIDDLKRGFGIARILEPKIIIESVKTARRRNASESRRGHKQKEESQPYLTEDVAALSAPEAMTEKEVLEYAPLESAEEEKTTEGQAEDVSPLGSFFGRKSSEETGASQETEEESEEQHSEEDEK